MDSIGDIFAKYSDRLMCCLLSCWIVKGDGYTISEFLEKFCSEYEKRYGVGSVDIKNGGNYGRK